MLSHSACGNQGAFLLNFLLKAVNHSIYHSCVAVNYVIIIPPDSYPRFENIVEDIKKIFSKPWFLKDADYYCTMSMGIVTFPDAGDSVTDLIKKADIAMYEAKKTGKNRVETYREGKKSTRLRRLGDSAPPHIPLDT